MFQSISRTIVSSSRLHQLNKCPTGPSFHRTWIRSASKIPPGIIGKRKQALAPNFFKPRIPWTTGDIDPYPNFDLSKIFKPGLENSEELKTADERVQRLFTLEFGTRAEIEEFYSNYLVKAVQRHPLDESSYEVLIAKLTARIRMHMKYGDIDPRKNSRRQTVANLQKIRNFLLNKLMEADYDVYQWLKNLLKIEHEAENPFSSQVDYDDREVERMKLQDEARNRVQEKKNLLKKRFDDEKEKFLQEKTKMIEEIRCEFERLQSEIESHNEIRRRRTKTIVE